ncbi:MAG TPA: glutamate ABC transporter substrate-binding protein [Pseudonocardiaceae bacterium]|jgi:polar amino acid transport system substrate-binding protein|nr:glutamate ABC transporter substrate-binding protein [Pseudonocardiaceae bacterium]
MSVRNRSRGWLGAGGLLLAALLTGCASNGPVNLPIVSTANAAMPVGVVQGSLAVPSAPPAPTCNNPTASLRPPASMPAAGAMPAGTTMARIAARGYLIAGVDQNTYLFGYRDPKTNAIEGFDIDMAHYVAKAIFGDPSRVQFKAITSAQRVPELKNGQVDIIARTMTISCARLADVNFSTVYYDASQRLLVPATSSVTDISQLGGKKICAASGSDSLGHIAAVPTHPIPVAVGDWSDCLVMLQQGEVAGVSTDDTILAGMVAQDPNTKIVGPSIADEPYGLAMPKQDTDFVSFVNGVLDGIRTSGQWTQSYQTWIGDRIAGGSDQPPAAQYSN